MHAQRMLLAALLVGVTGCHEIPQRTDPAADPRVQALAAKERPALGTVAVAPVANFALATDEAAKGWKVADAGPLNAENVRADIAKALEAGKGFSKVHATGPDALAEAWEAHDDVLVTVSLTNLRTRYDGRNGWWIPNIANWLFWIVPSWWVATEEYSLTLDAVVDMKSAESGARLATRTIKIESHGTFNEFDRGWQFFGFIYSSLDAEGWRGIASTLFPAAQSEIAVRVAQEVEDALRTAQATKEGREAKRKILAVSVGVTRYLDPVRLPPLQFAAEDARAVAGTLEREFGVASDHAARLIDGEATVPALKARLGDLLSRATDGDAVVVYFAGYGTRAANGEATLLFSDAKLGAEEGHLTLSELARLLAPVKGTKLLVIDAAFEGGGRSVQGGTAGAGDDLELLAKVPGLVTIVAGGPKDAALSTSTHGSGLFTYHVLKALSGKTHVTAQEILEWARPRVVAEAALLGATESPRGVGLDRPFALDRLAR
jgi:hypothetical protein